MPMPDPRPRESEEDYVTRCVPTVVAEGRPQKQAAAICHSRYNQTRKRRHKKDADNRV